MCESEIKWRRKWTPNLNSCPWKCINLSGTGDGDCFLVKAKFTEISYEILVTDRNKFFYEKLEENVLKTRSRKLNPSIEAPLAKITDQIQNMLLGAKNLKAEVERSKDSLDLILTSQLAGLPFTWTFYTQSAPHMALDHLTAPLLTMVGELTRQKRELFKLLEAKDKQIDDYKTQGAQVSRKHFETAPFNQLAFHNNMLTSQGFEEEVKLFGEKIFDDSSQKLYTNICTKKAWLRHQNDGVANDSEEEEGVESLDQGQGQSTGPSVESWANRIPQSMTGLRSITTTSPSKSVSPVKISPAPSPSKMSSPSKSSSTESTPVKDTELLRRQALERKLEQEETKKNEKAKKKKKLKL